MSNPLLDQAYPDVTTADISGAMPVRGNVPSKASLLADILRHYQGGMLTKEQMDRGYDQPARDILSNILPSAQPYAADALRSVPDPVWTAAAFIGPKGAANLASAGIRHPADWGGTDRLAAARAHSKWFSRDPEARASIWQELGWTPENTWGMRQGPGAQPATHVATPKFAIDESQMAPMQSGKHINYRGEGQLKDLITGIDDLLVAEPSIANWSTMLEVDPSLRSGWGRTSPDMRQMRAAGRSKEEMSDIGVHELNHVTALGQGVTPSTGQDQIMQPIMGTKAEHVLSAKAQRAQSALEAVENGQSATGAKGWTGKPIANIDNLSPWQAQMIAQASRDNWQKAPGYAGYLALAEEQASRTDFLMHKMIKQAQARGLSDAEIQDLIQRTSPGLVNSYQKGAQGADFKDRYGVPLHYYRPPE